MVRQPESRRRRGSNRAGARSDCHASLPQNCTAWGCLHPRGGRKVFLRGGRAGPEKHFSSFDHLLTGGASRGEVRFLLTCPHSALTLASC